MNSPTNADLMQAIIRISNDRVEDRVLLTTLRDSYRSRLAKAEKFETDMRTQVGETKLKVNQLQREVAVMRPVVKRMRMRTVLRRAFVECFGRWWGLLTTAAFTVGGLVVWFGDHWPKIVAFLRKAAGVILPIAIVLALAVIAQARDDGRYAASPLKDWVKGLKDKLGNGCCDMADGFPAEVEWDTEREHYRVRIEGVWYVVPPDAVLTEPNKLGFAMVWYWRKNGVPQIRCFIAGAGG